MGGLDLPEGEGARVRLFTCVGCQALSKLPDELPERTRGGSCRVCGASYSKEELERLSVPWRPIPGFSRDTDLTQLVRTGE